MASITHGRYFIQHLLKLGVVPEDTRRVIIDAHMDRATIVYVEQCGTKELLLLGPTDLKDAEIRILKRGESA